MKIAVYPGSFDPITNGHLDIITRASKLFDKLYVLVSFNIDKKYIFDVKERVELIKKVTSNLNNVEVVCYDGLVYDFALKVSANAIIKGIRNHQDFDNELTYYQFNHNINCSIETLLMFPNLNNLFVSSSAIKQLIKYDGDISLYIPEIIIQEVTLKIKERL